MHFKVHFRCLSTIFRTTWQRPDNAIKYTVRALVAHRMVHKLINVFYGVVATKRNNNARVWGKGKRRGPFPKFGRSHLQRGVTLHTCIRCPPCVWPFLTHVQSREETNSSRRRRQWQFSDAWKLGQKCSSTSPLTALNAITSLEDCLYNVLGSEFGSILFHLS